MNFYSFHIGDYMTKTRHLSWEEDMAYRRLLDVYYTSEKPLPADKKAVYRLVLAQSPKHRQAVDIVLGEFFELGADGFRNLRCDEELAGYQAKRDKARAAAQVSVQVRGQSNKELRAGRLEAAREKATHTKAEWLALVEVSGGICVKCQKDSQIEKDHIVPVYQGGSDGIENLQPLCRACNAAKGPDSTDYRRADWRAQVERLLNVRSTSAQRPLSEGSATNTITNTNTDVSVVARARPDDLEARLREAAGWQSDPSPNLMVTGPIEGLLASGADLEADVLPIIRAIAPKARGRSWKFFLTAIAQARDDRVAAAKIVSNPTDRRPGYVPRPTRKSTVDTILDNLGSRDAEGDAPARQA